jgi:hypothetical protein
MADLLVVQTRSPLDPHAVHVGVKNMKPALFHTLFGPKQHLPPPRRHRLMRLNFSKPRVLETEIAETTDQYPLMRVGTSFVSGSAVDVSCFGSAFVFGAFL